MSEQKNSNDQTPERPARAEGNFYRDSNTGGPGMNPRIQRLRKLSVETEPSLSIERAVHETNFYKDNYGKYSIPVYGRLIFLITAGEKHSTLAMTS